MKVAVTGGSGRLGQYTLRELAAHGHGVVSLDLIPTKQSVCRSLSVDLRNPKDVCNAVEGAEALVHLARQRFPYTESGFDPVSGTWKTADIAGDAERFGYNVAITYNVLAASWHAGVKKIVCGSSLAVYGLYYPSRPLLPDYLPVDEDHPLRPEDPYGISKLVGEKLCDAFARKTEMQIASLRFAGIATEAQYPILLERRRDPLCRGTGALWSYIDARDAAIACRLALETDFQGHQAFNICASTTIMKVPTLDLIRNYLPEVKQIKLGLQGNWSGYDTARAERVLGFTAHHLLESGLGDPSRP